MKKLELSTEIKAKLKKGAKIVWHEDSPTTTTVLIEKPKSLCREESKKSMSFKYEIYQKNKKATLEKERVYKRICSSGLNKKLAIYTAELEHQQECLDQS